jgi:hypothetical protein
MSAAKAMAAVGTVTTIGEFIRSLPADQFMVEDHDTEGPYYFPVEELLEGIAPGAEVWENRVIVTWRDPQTAIVCGLVPGAKPHKYVHKDKVFSQAASVAREG